MRGQLEISCSSCCSVRVFCSCCSFQNQAGGDSPLVSVRLCAGPVPQPSAAVDVSPHTAPPGVTHLTRTTLGACGWPGLLPSSTSSIVVARAGDLERLVYGRSACSGDPLRVDLRPTCRKRSGSDTRPGFPKGARGGSGATLMLLHWGNPARWGLHWGKPPWGYPRSDLDTHLALPVRQRLQPNTPLPRS